MYLQECTTENFVREVCKKSSIDNRRVGEVLFFDSEGIIKSTNDAVLEKLPNEQPLDIEFVPASAGSIGTYGVVGDLKMRVHL